MWDGSPAARTSLPLRWMLWRHAEVGSMRNRTLESQQQGNTSECPRGARMALKHYSDNEAVRSRGDGLVSTPIYLVHFFLSSSGWGEIKILS